MLSEDQTTGIISFWIFHEATVSFASGNAGDGSQDHLDEPVDPPKEIPLEDGQFEVGRGEDATLRLALPTVSSKHAIIRVGQSLSYSVKGPLGRLITLQEI